MAQIFKLKMQLEFNDLEYDDLCEAVQAKYGTVTRTTIQNHCLEQLGVDPSHIIVRGLN